MARRVLILDSEAVSALAEKRKGMAERLAAAQQADHRVLIPAVVLAEVATGAPTDAAIWHVLAKISTLDLPEGVAMRAGALRTRTERVRRKMVPSGCLSLSAQTPTPVSRKRRGGCRRLQW